MANNCDNDSDSSDDLPDLFGSYSPRRPSEILVGDIVWAKWNRDNLFWPAIVRHVDKKKRRVRVWFTDLPNQCFYIPFKGIHDFKDPEFKNIVKDQVKDSPNSEYHEKQVDKAITYLYRKAFGTVDDLAAYFEENNQYFCNERQKELINLKEEAKSQNDLLKISSGSSGSDNEQNEPNPSSDEETDSNDSPKKIPNLFIDYVDNSLPSEKASAVVSCIKSGYVDKHLENILFKKVECERQIEYEEATNSNRRSLWENVSNVYIKEDDKLFEIFCYLANLYENLNIKFLGSSIQQYLNCVWLPEALEKAVQLIDSEPNLPMTTEFPPCKVPQWYNLKRKWLSFEKEISVNEKPTKLSSSSASIPVPKQSNVYNLRNKRLKNKSPN